MEFKCFSIYADREKIQIIRTGITIFRLHLISFIEVRCSPPQAIGYSELEENHQKAAAALLFLTLQQNRSAHSHNHFSTVYILTIITLYLACILCSSAMASLIPASLLASASPIRASLCTYNHISMQHAEQSSAYERPSRYTAKYISHHITKPNIQTTHANICWTKPLPSVNDNHNW